LLRPELIAQAAPMPTVSRRLLLLPALCTLLAAAPSRASSAKPTWVDLYGGWAGPTGGHLYARIHTGKPPPKDTRNENGAEKLIHTLEQLELDAYKRAPVTISVDKGPSFSAAADGHGFIDYKLPAGLHAPLTKVTVSVQASKDHAASSATYDVPVWGDKPGSLGIISDIDDTLTDSDVPHKIHLLFNTLFHSQYDVKVFPGAGPQLAKVTGTASGFPVRPLFFLTGSPWNLHDRIEFAFNRNKVPKGAFVLRRFSKEPMKAYDFKLPHLQELFAAFPNTKWVLFGDTGEQDPEVYKTISDQRPDNLQAIFIHNVTKANPAAARFSYGGKKMTLFTDWNALSVEFGARGLAFGQTPK
jgi:phosphatidate phosphatase APP1